MARTTRLTIESLEARTLMAADFTSFLPKVGDPLVDPTQPPVEPTKMEIADKGDDPAALLLPAVQKVRDAAARLVSETLPVAESESDDGIALLLPAVQKVREAAAHTAYVKETVGELPIDDGNNDEELGLLLPAVQKVREAALHDMPTDQIPDPTFVFDLDLSFVEANAEVYMKYELKNVLITSYSVGGH